MPERQASRPLVDLLELTSSENDAGALIFLFGHNAGSDSDYMYVMVN
jgi:hypothetical protein